MLIFKKLQSFFFPIPVHSFLKDDLHLLQKLEDGQDQCLMLIKKPKSSAKQVPKTLNSPNTCSKYMYLLSFQYFSNTMKPVFHILWYVRNTCIIADKNLPKTLNSPIPPQNTWPSFKFLHYFSNTLKQVFHILS